MDSAGLKPPDLSLFLDINVCIRNQRIVITMHTYLTEYKNRTSPKLWKWTTFTTTIGGIPYTAHVFVFMLILG